METYDLIEVVIFFCCLAGVVKFQDYRLKKVEKRLDEHNHYAKMFSDTKIQIAEIKKDIENINYNAEQHYQAILKIKDKIEKL